MSRELVSPVRIIFNDHPELGKLVAVKDYKEYIDDSTGIYFNDTCITCSLNDTLGLCEKTNCVDGLYHFEKA